MKKRAEAEKTAALESQLEKSKPKPELEAEFSFRDKVSSVSSNKK